MTLHKFKIRLLEERGWETYEEHDCFSAIENFMRDIFDNALADPVSVQEMLSNEIMLEVQKNRNKPNIYRVQTDLEPVFTALRAKK
jgi:hypothetical protein